MSFKYSEVKNKIEDSRVACLDCYNFRLSDEDIPYCAFESECCIENPEDTLIKSIDRPKFEKRR